MIQKVPALDNAVCIQGIHHFWCKCERYIPSEIYVYICYFSNIFCCVCVTYGSLHICTIVDVCLDLGSQLIRLNHIDQLFEACPSCPKLPTNACVVILSECMAVYITQRIKVYMAQNNHTHSTLTNLAFGILLCVHAL